MKIKTNNKKSFLCKIGIHNYIEYGYFEKQLYAYHKIMMSRYKEQCYEKCKCKRCGKKINVLINTIITTYK